MNEAAKTRASVVEASQRIAQGSTIALVLPDLPDPIITGSALALVRSLAQEDKLASVFVPPSLKSHPAFTHAPEEPLREFIISFDLARSPIKELKYERDPNRLNIILSPSGPIRREDVSFQQGPLLYDLVIALGIQNVGDAAQSLARAPELLYEKPILHIGSWPDAHPLGEINLLPQPEQTLPELIWELISQLSQPLRDAQALSELFGALAHATNRFDPSRTSAKAFALASELLEKGAGRLSAPFPAPERPQMPGSSSSVSLPESQLRARAVVRSRLDPDATLWSLITREDFLKTGVDSASVRAVLASLAGLAPAHKRAVLFWQDPYDEQIRTLVAFRDPSEEKRARSLREFSLDDPLSSVPGTARTFPEAEMKISQLLRLLGTVE